MSVERPGRSSLRVSPEEFERAFEQTLDSVRPSSGDDLLGMQIDFDAYLEDSDLLIDVYVRSTNNPKELIQAHCKRANSSIRIEALEAEIERIWSEQLRYRHYERHTLSRGEDEVRLNGLTVIDKRVFFVSASIVVALSG